MNVTELHGNPKPKPITAVDYSKRGGDGDRGQGVDGRERDRNTEGWGRIWGGLV